MLDCILPEIKLEINRRIELARDEGRINHIEKLALLTELPGTEYAWETSKSWWPNDEAKGQLYLLLSSLMALSYPQKESSQPATSALEWRDEILQTLTKLEELAGRTPHQYNEWWNNRRQIKIEKKMERATFAENEFGDPFNPEKLMTDVIKHDEWSPEEAVSLMRESLEKTQFNQGAIPLKPNSKHAKRIYFIRYQASVLKPVSKDWLEVTRNIAIAVFQNELSRTQVSELATPCEPNLYQSDTIERMCNVIMRNAIRNRHQKVKA